MQFNLPSPLQLLDLPLFREKEVKVYVKRDDLIHDIISGNKWRKLKYNLANALNLGKKGIVTFGGAHSNHLLATAFVCHDHGLQSIGIVRGERPQILSPTLQRCLSLDMALKFVSRTEYVEWQDQDVSVQFPDMLHVPEGGANEEGIEGCKEIVDEINAQLPADFITVDCGTGATLTGMVQATLAHQKIIGISVLKGDIQMMLDDVRRWFPGVKPSHFELFDAYHFGGYARFNEHLIQFMRQLYLETGIKTDPVYTGKQFFGVFDLIEKDYFPKNATIVITHTGGLQGIEGYEKRYGITIY